MSRCSPFPPPGYVVSRERYVELIDFIKVLKEKLRKEEKKKKGGLMREKRKEMREKKLCKEEFGKRDFDQLEAEEEDEFSNERKRRRKDAETETEALNQFQFEGISSITEEESDDSTGNNNNETKTTTGKRELSTSEEIEFKQLQLDKLFDAAAAALPPVNLDWLYSDTTKKTKTGKGDEDERRGTEERQRSESVLCCSWTEPHAQYLHEVDTFALPYVLPF